jgi:uncharacterized protein (TIGR03083 family)
VPTTVARDPMVELLRGAFAALTELGEALEPSDWDRPSVLPGWSVRDVLAHVTATELMLLGEDPPDVEVGEVAHVVNPVGQANEIWVVGMRELSTGELLDRFRQVADRRLAVLDGMSQADFDAPSWTPVGKDETYGRFMRIRHFDTYLHEHDIRAAVEAPFRITEADVTSSLDEVGTGLGYIVGRKAAMPDGARVRIDLTGPGARTWLVSVDGRATVVDRLGGPPTVELTMPAARFLRLAGGRADGGRDVEGTTTYGGDAGLSRQLADHLAFTI